ncbi:MAG: Gfo/Idh/MocA family oxidoreductase [Anaerolineae bacterium]|nr:Gfo/Idh/MocA family oxidoreductase [Anaerolineae bacterium]MDW8099276.1 Gfo/Idh/MocA family oxidoreductase [Anaerolineae bacterium]
MDTTSLTEVAIIGCGGMARHHIRAMLQQTDTTHIAVVCEPSPEAYAATAEIFAGMGMQPPPNQPDLDRLLTEYGGALDAAFIITPHVYHHDQAKACMEAGLDVLLEKPMVMNTAEARSLIEARDRTGKLLVVAFPGSLSPQIRTAVAMLRSGELGTLLSISAVVWQNWGPNTVGTWRQQPELSGGGFLFDTGAHMLNTVADLAGEDFVQVAAWLDHRGRPVDVMATVMGQLASGALVTMHACGEAIPSCASDVRVFCSKAILRTGIWGERLEIQRYGRKTLRPVRVPPSLGVWEQFLAVRTGRISNPCPPEVGLRMARLWDAIRASSAQGGAPVTVCESI